MSVGQQSANPQGGAQSSGSPGAEAEWDGVKEDVSEMAGAAAERGRQFVNSALNQATDYVDKRKNDAAQSVADVANSLREATRSFEDRPNIKTFVDSAAEGLDQLADTIRERSFADMYADVEEVARRHPAVLATAATVVGFMFARFLKASAEEARYNAYERSRSARSSATTGQQSGSRATASSGRTGGASTHRAASTATAGGA